MTCAVPGPGRRELGPEGDQRPAPAGAAPARPPGPSSSSVVGSTQCTSSYSTSTGWLRAPGPRAGRAVPRRSAPSAAAGSAPAADSARRSGCRAGRRAAAPPRRAPSRLRQQRLELVELALRRIIPREARRPLEQLDHRVERAVGVIGRAEWLSGVCGSSPSRSRSARDQARLADARARPTSSTTWPSPSFARSQRSSSSASSCSRPTSGVSAAPCRASKRPSAAPSPSDPPGRAPARRSP